MKNPRERASDALYAAEKLWTETGLTGHIHDLVQEVWSTNLSRHEPDELGDSARTLGFVCYENLSARIERRIVGHPQESVSWGIDGLRVTRPQGSMRVELGHHQFWMMKAPMDAALQPNWDQFASWETDTQTRASIARRNSISLGGYISSPEDQEELFPYRLEEHLVDSFLFVWGGEINSGLTAGWLTVPVLGETPFAATTRLWRDEAGESVVELKPKAPIGPSYEQRASAEPLLRIKARPSEATGEHE